MHRATHKERAEFVALIQQHAGGDPNRRLWFAERVMRYGATLGRIAENECNGHQTWDGRWDERAALRDEKKEERIQQHVLALCKEFECLPDFSGDPRGATLKIQVPSGFTNDWGKEGICVPTS